MKLFEKRVLRLRETLCWVENTFLVKQNVSVGLLRVVLFKKKGFLVMEPIYKARICHVGASYLAGEYEA